MANYGTRLRIEPSALSDATPAGWPVTEAKVTDSASNKVKGPGGGERLWYFHHRRLCGFDFLQAQPLCLLDALKLACDQRQGGEMARHTFIFTGYCMWTLKEVKRFMNIGIVLVFKSSLCKTIQHLP